MLRFALAGMFVFLPLVAQHSDIDTKSVTELIRYNERWPQTADIRISDPVDAPEMPGYRRIAAQFLRDGKPLAQRMYYVSADGKHLADATTFEIGHKPFEDRINRMRLGSAPSYGPAGAPVSLVIFSDFECPFCAKEAKILRDNVAKDFPKEVRVFFKDYPLDFHKWSKDAAIAGRCVYRQNPEKFWKYHDWMFAHQSELDGQNLRDRIGGWASSAGVDRTALETCFDTRATEAEVEQNKQEGFALGVAGTPAVFLNGRALEAGRDWDILSYYIRYEVNAQEAERCCAVGAAAEKK